MKKQIFISFHRVLAVLMLLIASFVSAYGQSVIRRTPTKKTKTHTTPVTQKRKTTVSRSHTTRQRPRISPQTRRRSYNNYDDYAYADSCDTDEVAEDERIKEFQMDCGYELWGRVIEDYSDNADAQKDVRTAIQNTKKAKTGCLTDHKAVVIFGGNGYNYNGLPSDMVSAMKYCNDNRIVIDDVCVTDAGYWCVVYGGNKFKGNLPSGLRTSLDNAQSEGENILSVSISENGDYAWVTDNKYGASNDVDKTIMEKSMQLYGDLRSVCITNKGCIATCVDGLLFWDVPLSIVEKISNQDAKPKVVRFTDSGTFIALDGESLAAYYM